MRNRVIAGILSVAMILYILLAIIPPVLAAQNTITISSKEDFIEFSKNCTLDTWSQGKTVNLTCDIDFTDSDFAPIPTFGGTFNGNGYTISGVNFSKSGSYVGIFRYVQQSGKISNLNVKANFTPTGSKSFTGGIVGENYGTLELCSFEGTVQGQNVIGGIVGNNADSGQILSCTSMGSVIGENSTGGIAGKNSGFIQSCTNHAAVNTVYEEKKNDVSNIDTDPGAIIENYKTNSEENEEEGVLGHSDTGGIAGYSSGIVQGCTNHASVGYQHIGYNVGGIAGRQSGYMLGCENHGFIQGRKDVGGIVGQAEPYILLNISESGLEGIRQELDNLNQMVNRFITDTDNLGTDAGTFGTSAEKHLTGISEYSKTAQGNAEILLNQGAGFIDDNLSEINAQTAILSNTLDKLIPVFESFENGGEDLKAAFDKTAEAFDEIKIYAPDLSDEIDDITDALSEISRAEHSIKQAASRARRASNDLDDAIEFSNQTKVKNAVSELSSSIKDVITARQRIKTALETIENILTTRPESFKAIGVNLKRILENIKPIKDNVDITISSLQTIEKSLDTIILNTEIDFSEFKYAARDMEAAMGYLGDAMYYVTNGMKDLGTAIENTSDELGDYADNISEEINAAKNTLADAVSDLSYVADDITVAINNMKDIIADLSQEEPLEFVKLGDDFKAASEDLFQSLSDISGEIDGLKNEIDGFKNTVSNGKETITNNLTSIINQFHLVMDLLMDEFENMQDGISGISDRFLDVSDEDIENTRQGKVAQCHNFGNVESDRNTGGIAGAMAIEYAKDPEDDIEKPDALNFTCRKKAILQECINDGRIIGKKDCTGGIAGLSEIGTIYECQNYADTESTNGNYVGGIAGKSESAIRKSYAKSKLGGKRYVGGIAGKADIVTGCYTIVNVTGDENTGSICGDAENKDNLYQNFYVNNGLGAVDGISYSEKALPVTFDELRNISGIPKRFISFTVTFIVDDKIVETQDIQYGEETAKIKYPPIPPKDGHFGRWEQIEAETVTENMEVSCEYKPYITVLASSEKDKTGKLALALCEGEFTDEAELHITDSTQKAPANTDGEVKVYDISLINTNIQDGDTVTIRILNENKDKVTAQVLKDGNWEKAETTNKGKYVILETEGIQNTVCLKYEEREFNAFWLILIALLIIASLCIIKFRKSKRKA